MGKIALLGAAGAIGASVVESLRSEGTPYRVVGRSEGHLRQTFGGDRFAEIKAWNLDDESSVRQALSGVETAIYLIGLKRTSYDQGIRSTLEAMGTSQGRSES